MKKQAQPPQTIPIPQEAFQTNDRTTLYWLGNSGLFINSRGYCLMVDPVLEGFDLPLLIDLPLAAADVPALDSLLFTHADNDHFSLPTVEKILPITKAVHAPLYVADLVQETFQYPAIGHTIHETIVDGSIKITLTPADHLWQNTRKNARRVFQQEDFCGFWIETTDGRLWIPGDSRLLPEHLEMPQPEAILFDFSDNDWHIGFDNAVLLANTYPQADLILSHWGTVDAPEMDVFNGDPQELYGKVTNPKRIRVLAAGEPFQLKKNSHTIL